MSAPANGTKEKVTRGRPRKLEPVEPPIGKPDGIECMRIWVSGGVSGLGFHLAEHFLREGCQAVMITDIADETEGERVAAQLRATASNKRGVVKYVRADVRDRRGVEESMRKAAQLFGDLDAVVNMAGVLDEGDLRRSMDVNAIGVIEGCEAAMRVFDSLRRRDGAADRARARSIVNVSSASGVFALEEAPYYTASKHAVVGYSRAVAGVGERKGVRVVCVCPAWVDVGLTKVAVRQGVAVGSPVGVMKVAVAMQWMSHIVCSLGSNGDVVYLSAHVGARFVSNSLRRSLL